MSENIKLIHVGADVELFLKDKETNEIISAEGYVKGYKHDPFQFDPDNKYYSTQLDNVLAELTIPPVSNKRDFLNSLRKAMAYLENSIPSNFELLPFPSAILDNKYLQTENAQTFG